MSVNEVVLRHRVEDAALLVGVRTMFDGWGTRDYEDQRVQTPDGPGVVTSSSRKHVFVKLSKGRGRPRKYPKRIVKLIDTSGVEEFGGAIVEAVAPVPLVGRFGAKFFLKDVFARLFRHKTGY